MIIVLYFKKVDKMYETGQKVTQDYDSCKKKINQLSLQLPQFISWKHLLDSRAISAEYKWPKSQVSSRQVDTTGDYGQILPDRKLWIETGRKKVLKIYSHVIYSQLFNW